MDREHAEERTDQRVDRLASAAQETEDAVERLLEEADSRKTPGTSVSQDPGLALQQDEDTVDAVSLCSQDSCGSSWSLERRHETAEHQQFDFPDVERISETDSSDDDNKGDSNIQQTEAIIRTELEQTISKVVHKYFIQSKARQQHSESVAWADEQNFSQSSQRPTDDRKQFVHSSSKDAVDVGRQLSSLVAREPGTSTSPLARADIQVSSPHRDVSRRDYLTSNKGRSRSTARSNQGADTRSRRDDLWRQRVQSR